MLVKSDYLREVRFNQREVMAHQCDYYSHLDILNYLTIRLVGSSACIQGSGMSGSSERKSYFSSLSTI